MSKNEKINVKSEPTDTCQTGIENLEIKSEPSIQNASSENTQTTSSKTQATEPAKRDKPKFVPNLGVERVKREIPDSNDNREQKQPRRVQPNLNAARGRGRGRDSNLIQSQSIFEAGAAEPTKRFGKSQESYGSYSKVMSSEGSGSHNTRSKKLDDGSFSKKEIKVEETIVIQEAKEEEKPVYIKLKYDAKENDHESNNDQKMVESRETQKLREIFNVSPTNENVDPNKLILFQIPEHLSLQDLEEGHIGKLRIHKSGRIELVLNNDKYFDISLSVSADFLQDAVALEINSDSGQKETGTITNLGHIKNKVVCSPRFF